MHCASITSTLGSCLDLDIVYTDENNAPENITGNIFEVYSASRPALKNAVLTISNAAKGEVNFSLSAEHSAKLSHGNINWFRIRRTIQSGCSYVSEKIWVNMV